MIAVTQRRTAWVLALGLVVVVVLGVVALSTVSAAAKSCTRSSGYGTQCETIHGDGLTIADVRATFTTAPDFFTQHTWTFETTTYRCDPRRHPKSECAPEDRTYGPVHRPDPGNTDGTVEGSALATAPRHLPGPRWVCVEVAVRVNGEWVDNGAGLPSGDRACRSVH